MTISLLGDAMYLLTFSCKAVSTFYGIVNVLSISSSLTYLCNTEHHSSVRIFPIWRSARANLAQSFLAKDESKEYLLQRSHYVQLDCVRKYVRTSRWKKLYTPYLAVGLLLVHVAVRALTVYQNLFMVCNTKVCSGDDSRRIHWIAR